MDLEQFLKGFWTVFSSEGAGWFVAVLTMVAITVGVVLLIDALRS